MSVLISHLCGELLDDLDALTKRNRAFAGWYRRIPKQQTGGRSLAQIARDDLVLLFEYMAKDAEYVSWEAASTYARLLSLRGPRVEIEEAEARLLKRQKELRFAPLPPAVTLPHFVRILFAAGLPLKTREKYSRQIATIVFALRQEDMCGSDQHSYRAVALNVQGSLLQFFKDQRLKKIELFGSMLGTARQRFASRPDPFWRAGDDERLDNYIAELEALTGLDAVKAEMKALRATILYRKARAEAGINSPAASMHMVFTGNPGTGKTTIARLIGRMLRETGILKKGHFIEADREALVGTHVGHTAIKTKKMIERAKGGILFVDEAYTLTGEGDQFGREAIATLIQGMEDHRDELVVILAGYPAEMEGLLASNPGMKSRINRYIDFPDYSAAELTEIFEHMISEYGLTAGPGTRNAVHALLAHERALADHGDKRSFGNARLVRNLVEKLEAEVALRLMADPPADPDPEQPGTLVPWMQIEAGDVAMIDLATIGRGQRGLPVAPGINMPRPAMHFDLPEDAASRVCGNRPATASVPGKVPATGPNNSAPGRHGPQCIIRLSAGLKPGGPGGGGQPR